MDIGTKLAYIKRDIFNIVTHDDAPVEEVADAIAYLADYINEAAGILVERRAAIVAAREEQMVTSDDVGDAASVLGL